MSIANDSFDSMGGEGEDRYHEEVTAVTSGKDAPAKKRPSSSSQPRHSNPQLALFERGVRRKEQKSYEFNKIKEELENMELEGCTFHPNINNPSNKRSSTPVVARLYVDYKSKLREWEHEKKQKEDDEFQRTCTFKPQTNSQAKRASTPTRHRPSSPSSSLYSKENSPPKTSPSYSFTPVVNKITPNMGSVAQYLERDPFERLSTTTHINASPPHASSLAPTSSASASASHDSRARSGSTDRRASTPSKGRRPSSAPPKRETLLDDRRNSFNDFLSRQQEHVVRKQHKTKRLSNEASFRSQPAINPRSQQLVKQRDGNFLDRLAKDAEKRSRPVESPQMQDCTFQPTILQSSKLRKPRSVEEMSIGDYKKREELIEAMKKQQEHDSMVQATFQPRILQHTAAQSRLKILSDPDSYLDRITREQEAKEELSQEWIAKQTMLQEAECTFKPETRPAPDYVQRIAKSMAIARSANRRLSSSSSDSKKPDWV